MPNTTRPSTTDGPDTPDTTGRSTTSKETAAAAKATTAEAATDTAAAGSGTAASVRTIITMPATVARQVADDVVTTVRRPDAVLYIGGLVGLAAIGILEWPVVAAAGVGVAVANGVRRVRA